MSSPLRALGRLRAFLFRRRLDADLDAELASHIDFAIEEGIEMGLSRAEARRKALIRFGGVQQAREHQREARGLMSLDILLQDLKYTLRTLGRDPGFTTVAVLILALAIGANVAVFSVVNTLMLRPFPFRDAQQLVWIAPPPTKCGLSCATYSTDAYDEIPRGQPLVSRRHWLLRLLEPRQSQPQTRQRAHHCNQHRRHRQFLSAPPVQPTMGRTFTADDARNGAPPVILLSNAWWRRQFNADPNIVGKTYDIDGKQTTLIGVLPASFDFGALFSPGTKVDAITPLNLYGPPRDWGNIIAMIGRLKPGISLAQAVDEAARVAPSMCWNNKRPETCGSYKGAVIPVSLKDYVSGKLRQSLVVLWAAVGSILLIACVNLSNLLLARAAARSKEFAMRGALGASRGRIVRQLLTESLVLSGAGGIVGLLLAISLITWLAHEGAIALPLLSTLRTTAPLSAGPSSSPLCPPFSLDSSPACAWHAAICMNR